MPTFLFTDIENSTRLWEKYPAEMGQVLARHDALLREVIARHGGRVIKHTGDGLFAVFEGGDPLACALEMQKGLAREDWGAIGELRVRIALHAGEAERRGDDYFGSTVNRTARLLASGWGGQILLSQEAAGVAPLPAGATLQDLGFHFFKDLGEPQQVYRLVHPDLARQEFPPLRSLATHPHNLPPQPTPFIGREAELAEIGRRLDDPSCRLLTLTGPGGIGKTRLALQAAAEKIESFPHGVYFVPLAALSAADFIVPAIAEALRFPFYGREDPRQQLFNYLREKSMLLLLDNFEHLIAGAGLVADILQNAPQVKVLVTSRERLDLHGEHVFPLEGMPVPPAEEVAGIEEYSAVQLFLQSARRVAPRFVLSEEERPAVIRICQLVRGIPLGIELASTWVRMLSCREIAQEIGQSVDFLATTLRDMPERHRSLRAVFDYSWALLPEEEKAALRKLSVFRGGFRREAAARVCGASMPLLLSLMDKSLLRTQTAGRYEVLEVLRQYAEEKLRQDPAERAATQEQHSAYFADFLQQREARLRGDRQREALAEIAEEIENVRAGWEHALDRCQVDQIDRYLEGLSRFYEIRGWSQEGEEALERAAQALAASGDGQAVAVLGRVWIRQGWFCFRLGAYARASELLGKGLAVARRFGLQREIALGLNTMGNVSYALGDYAQARQQYQESRDLFREIGDRTGVAIVLNNMGNVACALGEYEPAKQLLRDSLAIYQEAGNQASASYVLNNLGYVACMRGEFDEAKQMYRESLAIRREIGDTPGIAASLNNLGNLAHDLGEHAEARLLLEESLAMKREIGDRWGIAISLDTLGDVLCALEEFDAARQHFYEAIREAMAIGALPLVLEALVGLAALLVRTGEKEEALPLLLLAIGPSVGYRETQEKAAHLLAELEEELPPAVVAAARAHGETRNLEEVVADLLRSER